ncbi:MAG TPA: hypothetical protein DDZ67_00060 [Xanthomonadaceae bacterium]|nr:hypothetical protein [Xanthomonadaceae bacterium]
MKYRYAPVFALAAAFSGAPAALAAQADAALGEQLRRLGYDVASDADGTYRILFGLKADDGAERSQVTYVRSSVERYGSLQVREIWSPAYQSGTDQLDAAIANRLLQDSQDSIVGGWVQQRGTAVFVVKVPVGLDDAALSDALEAATRSADAMEAELSPGQDEF